jgi:hypothetical protein
MAIKMAIKPSIGTPTANSYWTVASADAYFETKDDAETWRNIASESTGTLSATTRKENLLIQATREIDRNLRFQGSKYRTNAFGDAEYQNLEFPRASNILAGSSDTYIPDEVKYGTAEQSLWILERVGKRTTEDGQVIEKQVLGDECINYLNPWINRQIKSVGQYPWEGSKF